MDGVDPHLVVHTGMECGIESPAVSGCTRSYGEILATSTQQHELLALGYDLLFSSAVLPGDLVRDDVFPVSVRTPDRPIDF